MDYLNFEDERINFTPLILYINYINLLQEDYYKKNFVNIAPVELTYLMNIFYHQNLSQKDLAKLLFVSEANVAQIIKKLDKKGLVLRTTDESNKSRKILNLTNEGKLLIFKLLKEMYEWESEFFKDYDPEDVVKFKKMLYEYSQKTIDSI